MFFLFGTGSSVVATELLPTITCQYCHTTGSVAMSVTARYLQVFFIPVIPLGKSSLTVCGHCRQVLEAGQHPAAYRAPMVAVEARAKTPFWHFALLAIFGAFLAFAVLMAVVVSIRGIGQPDPAVPVAGQRFKINLADDDIRSYALAEIERVTTDTVYYHTTGLLRGPLTPATATVALRDSLGAGNRNHYPVAQWHFLTTGAGRMRLYQ